MALDIWQRQREEATTLDCGLKVLKGLCENGRPFLMIWRPKAIKPFFNYQLSSPEHLERCLTNKIAEFQEQLRKKEERKAERRGNPALWETVQVGFIFHCSWGYDQTNNDFYQVIAKKGQYVTLREIGQNHMDSEGVSPMADNVTASKDSFVQDSKPFTKKLQFSKGEPYVTMTSYSWAHIWDGSKKYHSWYA